jgi:hypothetical protein
MQGWKAGCVPRQHQTTPTPACALSRRTCSYPAALLSLPAGLLDPDEHACIAAAGATAVAASPHGAGAFRARGLLVELNPGSKAGDFEPGRVRRFEGLARSDWQP